MYQCYQGHISYRGPYKEPMKRSRADDYAKTAQH